MDPASVAAQASAADNPVAANTPESSSPSSAPAFASTVVIAAAIIAAVRLARDNISSPSPRVDAAVADSVSLARKILQRVIGA
jgi:hypothetical protein